MNTEIIKVAGKTFIKYLPQGALATGGMTVSLIAKDYAKKVIVQVVNDIKRG